jgi:hypothetical protein
MMRELDGTELNRTCHERSMLRRSFAFCFVTGSGGTNMAWVNSIPACPKSHQRRAMKPRSEGGLCAHLGRPGQIPEA